MLMTLREFKDWRTEREYVSKELSTDVFLYFTEHHFVPEKLKYKGCVCKFTEEVYGLYDVICDQLWGFAVVYKTSTHRQLIETYRL